MYTIDQKKKDSPAGECKFWTGMASPYKRERVQCRESLGIVLLTMSNLNSGIPKIIEYMHAQTCISWL